MLCILHPIFKTAKAVVIILVCVFLKDKWNYHFVLWFFRKCHLLLYYHHANVIFAIYFDFPFSKELAMRQKIHGTLFSSWTYEENLISLPICNLLIMIMELILLKTISIKSPKIFHWVNIYCGELLFKLSRSVDSNWCSIFNILVFSDIIVFKA